MADKKKKSFTESQPEYGALEDTFFKYIPDAAQVSNYIQQFLSDGKKKKASKTKKMKKGGAAFPDLTGDGKVTRADILKGRGVKGFKGGGCVMKGRGGSFKGTN